MDKKTGKPVEAGGKAVTSEAVFQPEKAEGSVEVTFQFDASTLTSGNIVVFEKLFITMSKSDVEITSHEDLKDKGQTVSLEVPEKGTPDVSTPVRTGDDTPILLYLGIAAAALIIAAAAGIPKLKQHRKKK